MDNFMFQKFMKVKKEEGVKDDGVISEEKANISTLNAAGVELLEDDEKTYENTKEEKLEDEEGYVARKNHE